MISEHLAVTSDADNDDQSAPDPDQVTPSAMSTPPVTPHLHALRHQRNLELAVIRKAWYGDARVQLGEKISEAETAYVSAAITKGLAKSRLDKVSDELTDEELRHRRRAEKDEDKWPEARVRDRRRNERDRARQEAEEDLLKESAGLSEADVSLKHATMTHDDQLMAAQAVGWQAFHHYGRREATYLRALARKHKHGPELVKLLRLAGPDLPEWLLRTTSDAEEGP